MQKMDTLNKDMKDLKDGQHKQHEYLDKQDKQNNKILMMLQMMQTQGGGGMSGSIMGVDQTGNLLSQSIAMNFRHSMKKAMGDRELDSSRRLETESQRWQLLYYFNIQLLNYFTYHT